MTALRTSLESLVRRGGELALRRQREWQETEPDADRAELKDDGTEVTAADREVQDLLVSGLADLFPHDAIRGEEGAAVTGTSGATWYVDPIDGTSSFIEGLAHWGPTVCRITDGRLDAGIFYQPRVDDMWYAEKGAGGWRNAVRLRCGAATRRERNQVLCGPSRLHRTGPIPWTGKIRVLGSSAAHLALVAAGGAAVTVIPEWSMWDVGCGVLLVEEAGRVVCDMRGSRVDVAAVHEGTPLVAGAPEAVDRLITAWWAERGQST